MIRSPYIQREGVRLGLIASKDWTPPLMDRPQGKQDHQASVRINAVHTSVLDSAGCVGSSSFVISKMADFPKMFPRTQREAGIEDLQWEDRLPPVGSWTHEILRAIGFIITIATIWWCFGHLPQWADVVRGK